MPSKKVLERKKNQVTSLVDELKDAESIVFADFQGLNVKQDTEMRAAFRSNGLTYRVVKNTISERAFEQLGVKGLEETLKGPTAIAYSKEDVVLAPRLMREYSEKFRRLKIKGGVIGGEVQEIDYIMALSRVESREKLYGQLLFMMLYPLTAFAQVGGQIAEKGAEAGVEKVADLLTADGEVKEEAAKDDGAETANGAEEASVEES
jgi:large subunit ribosomal protein L10